MKIVIDMNLSPQWVAILLKAGHEVAHWSDIGSPRASDQEILAWAAENSCVVFTNDLDFGALLAASGATGPSVIQVRTQDISPDSLGRFLVPALHQFEETLKAGALISIDEASARARVLPLR
jgi:predicted nuclease of predicted toxin-antitoxin system